MSMEKDDLEARDTAADSSDPQSAIRNPQSAEPSEDDESPDSDSASPPSEIRNRLSGHRPEDRWSIRFWRSVVILFSRLYHHLMVRNRNPLPMSGAAILVSNHISGLDPVLLQAASSRLIIWMMAKEYYDLKSLNWFFKIVEAIPVRRGSRDTSSTRAAIRALAAGRVLGIFPEGRIETSDELLPFHVGVAVIALRTKVPVYPAFLNGTTRGKEMLPAVLSPNTVSLRFGPRIVLNYDDKSKESLEVATTAIQNAVEALRQQEMALARQKNVTV